MRTVDDRIYVGSEFPPQPSWAWDTVTYVYG